MKKHLTYFKPILIILIMAGVGLIILFFIIFYSFGDRVHNIYKTTFLNNSDSLALSIRSDGNGSGIYLINKNGFILNRLTFPENNWFDVDVSASFDGSKIVFSRRQYGSQKLAHIFLMDQDGKSQKQITGGSVYDDNPLFSPDGQSIYFTRNENIIYSIGIDGSGLREITENCSFPASGFSISADGKKLVCTGSNSGNGILKVINLLTLKEIGNYKPDIGTYEPWPSYTGEGSDSHFLYPSFLSNSDKILFVGTSSVNNSNNTTNAIYLYDIKNELTKEIADVGSHFVEWPLFSPSGEELVFCSGFPYACSTLWMINVDGTNLHKITDSNQFIDQINNFSK
jgi:Tol biopolymer transport system component